MPHSKSTTYQFDLFPTPNGAEKAPTPQWQTLPAETRRAVTTLMVSLILDHIDGDGSQGQEETRHDA